MEFPFSNTKPEIKIQDQLRERNISFETQKAITGVPDIFIPLLNLCIFSDGCYWHACPECFKEKKLNDQQLIKQQKDNIINQKLAEANYNILRIWEHDIMKENFDVMELLNKVM